MPPLVSTQLPVSNPCGTSLTTMNFRSAMCKDTSPVHYASSRAVTATVTVTATATATATAVVAAC